MTSGNNRLLLEKMKGTIREKTDDEKLILGGPNKRLLNVGDLPSMALFSYFSRPPQSSLMMMISIIPPLLKKSLWLSRS